MDLLQDWLLLGVSPFAGDRGRSTTGFHFLADGQKNRATSRGSLRLALRCPDAGK